VTRSEGRRDIEEIRNPENIRETAQDHETDEEKRYAMEGVPKILNQMGDLEEGDGMRTSKKAGIKHLPQERRERGEWPQSREES